MAPRVTPTEVRFRSQAAMRTAKIAELLGWSLTWASHQHRALKARGPIDDKEILIPVTTSVNANRARATLSQILTHSGRERVDALFNNVEGDLTKDDELAELALELGMAGRKVDERMEEARDAEAAASADEIIQGVIANLVAEVRVEHGSDGQKLKGDWWAVSTVNGTYFECRDHEPPYPRVETRAGVGGHNRMMHGDPDEVAATQARAQEASLQKAADRRARQTEVSRVPWLAKKGSVQGNLKVGRVFEHQYVDEVTYADGTVEYECNICHDYTSDKGRPVAHHVGAAHKDRERSAEPETHKISDYPEPDYHRTPSHQRSPKLRSEVLSALDSIADWHLLSREELAAQIEERIMEARPERQLAEPLTDAEILARIAGLLDRGQFDQMRREVDALTQQVVLLTDERNEALVNAEVAAADAERARGNLRAFKELVNEVDAG